MKPLRATDPATIGTWTLLGRLGEGGQGVVYLARHTPDPREDADIGAETDEASPDTTPGEIGSLAAVKLFKETDTKFLAKELAAISQISGAGGCAQVLATGELDGQSWIATGYVDGPDLFTSVSQAGPFQGELLTTLAVATATALVAIHRAGVVHRDFKPSNVLLGPDGPVVIDFGVAHVLESAGTTSNIVGTPSYAAPEQLARRRRAGSRRAELLRTPAAPWALWLPPSGILPSFLMSTWRRSPGALRS